MSTTATAFAPKHAKTTPRRQPTRRTETPWSATRLRTAWGLIRLAWFLLTHPSVPVPVAHLNVRVPADTYDMRVAYLDGVADAYRTKAGPRFGCLVAERRFGPVTVEAHVKDADYTRQLIKLQDEQAAQAAGSGASA